jgi:hypothetical protein
MGRMQNACASIDSGQIRLQTSGLRALTILNATILNRRFAAPAVVETLNGRPSQYIDGAFLVLRLARGVVLVKNLEGAFADRGEIGAPHSIIGFDCILRGLEPGGRQIQNGRPAPGYRPSAKSFAAGWRAALARDRATRVPWDFWADCRRSRR